VNKPQPSKQSYEMGDLMLKAAATDRHARAILEELGAHRQVLWLTYATPSPAGMTAFSDLCSLALRSAAAREACAQANEVREPGTKPRTVPKFLQDLSARLIKADVEGLGAAEEDMLAMQAIVHECEPKLAAACRAFKSASRRFWASERAKTNAKDGARG
jgi:prophage DNA circulation protein